MFVACVLHLLCFLLVILRYKLSYLQTSVCLCPLNRGSPFLCDKLFIILSKHFHVSGHYPLYIPGSIPGTIPGPGNIPGTIPGNIPGTYMSQLMPIV